MESFGKMKKYRLLIIVFFVIVIIGLTWSSKKIFASESPFLKMDGVNSWSGISRQDLFNELVSANPLYLFSLPFTDTAVLTPAQIDQVHSQLPQNQVILHINCCDMFDQKEVDSPVSKAMYASQNTQAEFDNAWANHQDAFMKNRQRGYVYFEMEKFGNYWVNPGDAYLMDPANSFFQDFLYKKIKDHVINGNFDGVYLDLMYPVFMAPTYYSSRPADAHANNISNEQWRSKLISLSQYLQNQKQNDPDPKMKNAVILTNSFSYEGNEFFSAPDRIKFNKDLDTQGVQIENPFMNYQSTSTSSWIDTVNQISDLTALRNKQMKGWINYHLGNQFPDQAECDRHGLYAYSSYLLGNQSPYFAFYFECKLSDGVRKEPSQNLTHIRLGNAISSYQQTSSFYRREYEYGIILVNPTAEQSTYRTNRDLKDAYSAANYPKNTNIILPSYVGMVLLIPSLSPSPTPPTPTISSPPVIGNITNYGNVPGDNINVYDYNILRGDFGKTGTPGFIPSDIHKNGVIDIFDYNILVENFGK